MTIKLARGRKYYIQQPYDFPYCMDREAHMLIRLSYEKSHPGELVLSVAMYKFFFF